MARVICLDAGVIIAFFSPGDAHHERAKSLLATEEGPFVMHPLTAAETLVGAARIGRDGEMWVRLQSLGVRAAELGPTEPLLLARLRAEHGLKMPDTCALAAAVHHRAPLATFAIRLGSVADGLPLRHPISAS